MKLAVLSALIASAAAFAPAANKAASSTALNAADFSDALGAQAPVGLIILFGWNMYTVMEFDCNPSIPLFV